MVQRWNIHTYAGSLIPSFVGEDTGNYYLAHTDLDAQNIMIDTDGSITGIIDWEFASTLPPRDGEHYPKLLANKNKFVRLLEGSCDDPMAELEEMREFYAAQFTGDSEMEWYMDNVKAIDYLVDKCKFLPSPSALEQVSSQFPYKDPVQPPRLIGDSSHIGDSRQPHCTGTMEIAVQTDPQKSVSSENNNRADSIASCVSQKELPDTEDSGSSKS
jgi:hypothetical protein